MAVLGSSDFPDARSGSSADGVEEPGLSGSAIVPSRSPESDGDERPIAIALLLPRPPISADGSTPAEACRLSARLVQRARASNARTMMLVQRSRDILRTTPAGESPHEAAEA